MYILLAQRRQIFLEILFKNKKNWELTVYVQVYLFIIRYSYWIATNIIQFLVYLVELVSEYLSVFTQLYLRNGVSYCIKGLCNLSLEVQGPFMGERVLPFLGMVGRFRGDDPRFCDCQSDLVPIVWCNQIQLTPSFCRKISLCLSHLFPEIRRHKVGLI